MYHAGMTSHSCRHLFTLTCSCAINANHIKTIKTSLSCPVLNLYLNRYRAKAHFSMILLMSSSGSFGFYIFCYVLCWYVIVFSLRRTFWQFHKSFTSHLYVRYCSVSKSTHSTHKLMATWLEAIYSLGVVSCHVTCLSHSGWWIICHPYSLDWGPLF